MLKCSSGWFYPSTNNCNSQEFASVLLHKDDGDTDNAADGNVEQDQFSISVAEYQMYPPML